MVIYRVAPLAVVAVFLQCYSAVAVVEINTSEEFLIALESVDEFETIHFGAGSYSDICGIELSKSLTLIGVGQVELDCKTQDSQFRIGGTGVLVSLSNLAFSNGYSQTDGGCLSVSNGADVDIISCSFSKCASDMRGGALAVVGGGKIHITESSFTQCEALQGGAVSVESPESSVTMDGCSFRNNSAIGGGGGILLESASLEIHGETLFLGNMAVQGGAIAAMPSANSTNAAAIAIDGAAKFYENFGVSPDPTVPTQGGVFSLVGGSSLTCTGPASFVGNMAQGGGVVSAIGGTVLFAGATMDHNSGSFGGAISAFGDTHVILRDGTSISHSTVMVAGGAIYGEGQGVLVHVENGVRFEYGMAAGGGVMVLNLGVLLRLWDGVDLAHNHGFLTGGSFYIHHGCSIETRGRVRFHGNSANTDGGAIYLYTQNTATFSEGTSMDGNVALGRGGAMVLYEGSKLIADRAQFNENEATAGAISCNECTLHLSGCRFTNNAAESGAAIDWKGDGDCSDSAFEANVAENGGAVAHYSPTSVTLDGNTFFNNSAGKDGGCLAVLEGSVLHLSNSTFERCSSTENGAAVVVRGEATLYLSGEVTMTEGKAGGTGGGVHHQGKLLHVEEGAVVVAQANAAHGGGGVSSASTLTVGGQLRVLDNVAHAHGGGVQGFGFLSVTTVLDGGWLEVVGNEAAANGGGVALRDNARLTFSPSPCPAVCSGLGDGTCDSACVLPQCRWAAGDCDARLLQAGEMAAKPCNRDAAQDLLCLHISIFQPQCRKECFQPACDWGLDSCAAESRALGQCPYNSALIYKSLTAHPDVIYVKEGGTAEGLGRCESGTCSPADPTIGRDEPYCTTINDDGKLFKPECEDCPVIVDFGESWGPCSEKDKPRLPHIGFDYDPAELLAVLDMDIPTLLKQYPACGYQPLAIRSNRAGLSGGGVYKDGCNGFLESVNRCFVGELENDKLPTVVFDIADNHAGGPGGGVFVECGEMGACLVALAADSGLPDEARAAGKMLHFGGGSSTDAYGAEAAGLPVELELVHTPRNATPGQTVIDVGFRLLDTQRQVVQGSASYPNPHVVEVSVCRVGEACAGASALQEPFLLRSHPTDQVTATLRAQEPVARCPVDDPRVELHVRATGSSSEMLHKSAVVACQPCGPGQEMILEGDGAARVWSCRSCPVADYVVSAEGGCQACPLEGAACDGMSLTATVEGAEWAAEGAVMRLQTCPTGFILVRDPAVPVLDACVSCPPGKYSVGVARFPDKLAVERASEAPLLCSECVRGASCLGGADIIAQPGFWQDMAVREDRREDAKHDVSFYQCAPSVCEGNNTCSEGSRGPVCGLCQEGWGRQGLGCVNCGDSALGQAKYIPSFIVTIVFGALAIYILTLRPLCEALETACLGMVCCCHADKEQGGDGAEESEAPPTCLKGLMWHVGKIQWTSPAMIGAFKVAVSFFQVTSTFPMTFRIDWPDNFGLISSLGRLTGFDISLLLPTVACVSSQYDYFETLLVFTTAFPITITIVLCLPYLLTRLLGSLYHGGSRQHPKHERMQKCCVRAVLLWFFLIYPTVSEHTLSSFFCQDLGSGGHVLVMDKSVRCPWAGSSPAGGFYFSLFLVLLFPIGIPIFFYYAISAFFVPAMAASKSKRALFLELVKLYRAETSTPISVKLAQHVGIARRTGSAEETEPPGTSSAPGSPFSPGSPGLGSPALSGSPMGVAAPQDKPLLGLRHLAHLSSARLNSESSESMVPLQIFKRRVSTLFTQTFVQRELSGVMPEPSLHDKLQHVLERFGCSGEELARMVTVVQRLSISTGQEEELDGFEQLALKIARNHFLFTGHETLEELSLEQLQALFLFDWEGLNRKRSDKEIRQRKTRRQRAMRTMGCEELRGWVFGKAKELEKAARISLPALSWNGETIEEERALGYVGFLFDDFRVQAWRFFLVGEMCKLIMTSVIVFIPGRFSEQLAWGFFVQVCITSMYTVYQPMAEPWLNHFQVYAFTVQCATLFFGLILSISDRDDPDRQRALDHWALFLVCLKWSLVFYPLTSLLLGKAVASLGITVRRLVLGQSAGNDDREPTCLERVLFPTTTNEKLRRMSSESVHDTGRAPSVSDADLLGTNLPNTKTSTPRRPIRPSSSVDAQLGLNTPRLITPSDARLVSSMTYSDPDLPQPEEAHQDEGVEPRALSTGLGDDGGDAGLTLVQSEEVKAAQAVDAGQGEEVKAEQAGTGSSSTQEKPFLILSMTPTPRKRTQE